MLCSVLQARILCQSPILSIECKNMGIFSGKKTYKDEHGYLRFKDSGKLVHRWVMEKELGRKLKPEEVVHHKNRNKRDNRASNLRLYANQNEHQRHHSCLGCLGYVFLISTAIFLSGMVLGLCQF